MWVVRYICNVTVPFPFAACKNENFSQCDTNEEETKQWIWIDRVAMKRDWTKEQPLVRLTACNNLQLFRFNSVMQFILAVEA